MEERQEVEKAAPRSGRRKANRTIRYGFEFKLKAVKLHLEEGYPHLLICEEMGMGTSTLSVWLRDYRKHGEAGLRGSVPPGAGGAESRARLPLPVREKILELKEQNPRWGIKHIAQVLRRFFFLSASPETVRRKLHEAGLMNHKRPRARRNLVRPRFFERSTPNQMWQSDIFTFRLGGRYAYVIAFLDDYSRFVVGADLFRSPNAHAVIEVYRVAIGEYQPPKEMLTDNGRQYATWRGTSRFQAELRKDGVHHFKSRPQHPMTLGKIERFWATLWQRFLCRAQFESFESARERIKLWIKYYNHKRPHQGIDGLCPADRFFEIQSELRKTIEAGIKENLLEMALRGQPRAPFYMVGRMEGQSVVLRAEKGKLKLSVDADSEALPNELEYDLKQNRKEKGSDERNTQTDTTQTGTKAAVAAELDLHGGGKSAGGPGSVDRASAAGGSMPATLDQGGHVLPLAGPGDGRNAPGAGEPGQFEQRRSVESAAAEPAQSPCPGQNIRPLLLPAGEDPVLEQTSYDPSHECGELNEQEQRRGGAAAGGDDPASTFGTNERERRSAAVRHLAQDLLPLGEAGAAGDDGPVDGRGSGTSLDAQRCATGGDAGADRGIGRETQSGGTDRGSARHLEGDGAGAGEAAGL